MRNSDYLALFGAYVAGLKRCASGVEWLGRCPYADCRDKKTRKFYVNAGSGQFHCKRCDAKGNAVTFAKHFGDDPRPFYDMPGKEPTSNLGLTDLGKVDYFHQALVGNRTLWPLPWREEIIRRLAVGWDAKEEKLVFPIFDEAGRIENLIRHKGRQLKGARVSLYPANLIPRYDPTYLVICEGMKDCISSLSARIQAVTSTAGASSIPRDISMLRRFLRIYLCPDNDDAGDRGTDSWINRLQGEFPGAKLRVCDLSSFVGGGGDLTDYLSLPDKNGDTFFSEVLERARVGRPFSDVPDFIRQKMISNEFTDLKPRDRLVYLVVVLRAARYRVMTGEINRMRIRIQPGQYITSVDRLCQQCPPYTAKMVRTSLERMVKAGFIRQRDLHQKRGRIITIVGWGDSGQSKRQSDFGKIGKEKFPFPPSIIQSSTAQNGRSDFEKMGNGFGQHKESYSGKRKVFEGVDEANELTEKGVKKNGSDGKGENSALTVTDFTERIQSGRGDSPGTAFFIPRDSVYCGECEHFFRDKVNLRQGMGNCAVGVEKGPPKWPMTPRDCSKFQPNIRSSQVSAVAETGEVQEVP